MIRAELAFTNGARLDLSRLRTRRYWDRVCVSGPYNDNDGTRAVLGFEGWEIENYSKIATSDAISTLVFVGGKKVAYVIELQRGLADFAQLTQRCFWRDAVMCEQLRESTGFVPR